MQRRDFYTVDEAARALKLTPDRIRQMLRDGDLEGVPPQAGSTTAWKIPVRVIRGRTRPPSMDPSETPSETEDTYADKESRNEEAAAQTPKQTKRDDTEDNHDPTATTIPQITLREAARDVEMGVDALLDANDETIADLRDRVAFLERQLEDRTEEIRRRDHIIAALTERIPTAIEPPNHEESPRVDERTPREPARATPPRAEADQTGSRRTWWRRVLRR